MKRILVPVDFSDHTLNTCRYALEIAKKYSSEITLFHAYFDQLFITSPSLPDTYDINPYSNTEMINDIKQDTQIKIDGLEKELNSILQSENAKNVTIKTYITGGEFKYDLDHYCEDYHPSVIIIGARGKGDSACFYGVTATHIINNINWPILVVPVDANYTGIKNIMFATSLEQEDYVRIRNLFNKFDAFDVNVYYVHILGNENYLKDEVIMEQLKESFSIETKSGRFNCDILEGADHHKEILEYISKYSIDLIAFVPHKTSMFHRLFGQDTPNKELFNTSLPLLTVRD